MALTIKSSHGCLASRLHVQMVAAGITSIVQRLVGAGPTFGKRIHQNPLLCYQNERRDADGGSE